LDEEEEVVMDCPQHPIRKRPKACATCAANVGVSATNGKKPLPEDDDNTLKPVYWPEEAAPKPRSPRASDDGATWLDPDGNPPVVNAAGVLLEPFVFQLAHGTRERWMPGIRLPMAPAPYKAWADELAAKRARTIQPKEKAS